jgi:hypothetical protein
MMLLRVFCFVAHILDPVHLEDTIYFRMVTAVNFLNEKHILGVIGLALAHLRISNFTTNTIQNIHMIMEHMWSYIEC